MTKKKKGPESKVYLTTGNDTRVLRSLENHPFFRSLTITHAASQSTAALHRDTQVTYYEVNIRLSSFLVGDLRAAMIGKQISGISVSGMQSGNHFCVHNGFLRMSLEKQTYQRAGLEGHRSNVNPDSWEVQVNIADEMFFSSKRFRQIQLSLSTVLNEEVRMRLALVTGASVPAELAIGQQSCLKTSQTESRAFPDFDFLLQMPLNRHDHSDHWDVFQESQEELLTHLALLTTPETVPRQQDPYISTYSYSGTSDVCMTTTKLEGFLSCHYVLEIIRSILSTGTLDWFSIQLLGFEDTPWAWTGREHGPCMGGENHMTILSWRADQSQEDKSNKIRHTAMWEIVGAYDTYS